MNSAFEYDEKVDGSAQNKAWKVLVAGSFVIERTHVDDVVVAVYTVDGPGVASVLYLHRKIRASSVVSGSVDDVVAVVEVEKSKDWRSGLYQWRKSRYES